MVDWSERFFERRSARGEGPRGSERRQFADSHSELPPEAAEFARAVDAYKLANRRKFVTLAELFEIFRQLGYHK